MIGLRLLSCMIPLALAGCVVQPLNRDYEGPTPVPDAVRAQFTYDAITPAPLSVKTLETTDDYTIRRITIESTVNHVDGHEIVIDYYDLPGDEPTPVIMCLPTIAGERNRVANFLARPIARHGYAAVVVHRQSQYKDIDELHELNPVFRQIVLDHMQAIDWIETQPDLDADRIGVIGVSMGAIKASLVWALEPRVTAAALCLVGGDLPGIFTTSSNSGIRDRRDALLAEHDITVEELRATLTEELTHDPMGYAPYMDARDTLMILAAFDRVIPYRFGRQLRHAIGDPQTFVLPAGHYTSIVYLPFIDHASRRFFKSRFER